MLCLTVLLREGGREKERREREREREREEREREREQRAEKDAVPDSFSQ